MKNKMYADTPRDTSLWDDDIFFKVITGFLSLYIIEVLIT